MTCEVLVANRLGVALAADSAVTFTKGNSRESATYAAGANKIFQLSAREPVAVMIYNNADLQRVPWEVILKAYRAHLGNTTFPGLQGYCLDFIDFLNNKSEKIIPKQVRENSSRSSFINGVIGALHRVIGAQPILSKTDASDVDLRNGWSSAVTEVEADVMSTPVDSSLSEADLADSHRTSGPALAAELDQFLREQYPHLAPVANCTEIARIGIELAFRKPASASTSYSGLVIAGYGSDEYLPSYCCQVLTGFVGSRICWRNEKSSSVGYTDRPSLIEPFAQKSMVETFTQGASPEVWKAVREAFIKHAGDAAILAGAKSGATIAVAAAEEATHAKLDDFTNAWASAVFGAHLSPLHNVVSSLDVESLAELAETLVMLESLKEKVTARTQAVGGPIDLAVITKAEGLVWLKRKHYFNRDLNPRYLLRLQSGA